MAGTKTSVDEYIQKDGSFKRPPSSFRSWVSSEVGAEFPPEKGRYHLYIAYSCPWAHRTLILRKYKRLEDIISFTAMHWLQDGKGWRFATVKEQDKPIDMTPDPYHPEFTHLQDVFFESDPNYKGRYTTPTLYDTKTRRIVNNESADISRMLNSAFDSLLPEGQRGPNVLPASKLSDIDAANEWIYPSINNGVYRAGFATTQETYNTAAHEVFTALDRAEAHLHKTHPQGPYFHGAALTETDIFLYTTLIRFDPVYCQHFKLNLRMVRDGYPALHRWMRNLYWNEPAFGETTRFDHIRWNYTKSHTHINPHGITPLGPVPNVLPLEAGEGREGREGRREEGASL